MKINNILKIIFITIFILFGLGIFFKEKNPKNVILITIDSLRPDHLGCYGYKRNISPNIDKLAEEGVIFNQAIAQGPHTLISVPSFITSAYPYEHLLSSGEHRAYLNPVINSLPGILRQNNYKTAFLNDHPDYLERIYGLKDSFETNVELETNKPKELTESALNWLNKNKEKRLFLWLYYFGPHSPYKSSLPYSDMFYNDNLPKLNKHLPFSGDDSKEIFGVIPKFIAENNITDVDYYIANYDARIRIVDEQIGILLEGIKRLGLDKNTLIVIIADHGESLGEHNYYFRHGATLYDELLRVPFIVRHPQIIPKNKKIDYQVRLMDMAPTVIDFLGINHMEFKNMGGVSLKPYILQGRCLLGDVFSQTDTVFSIRRKGWKLIYINLDLIKTMPVLFQKIGGYYSNEYELYNLKEDPKELDNLFNKEKEKFEDLRKELDKHLEKAGKPEVKQWIKEYYSKDKIKPVDEQTKEKLKNLGYN